MDLGKLIDCPTLSPRGVFFARLKFTAPYSGGLDTLHGITNTHIRHLERYNDGFFRRLANGRLLGV